MKIIDLNTVYKETSYPGTDSPIIMPPITIKEFFNFTCTNCEQEYTLDVLYLAVFLYGIFFLASDKIYYWGITCPRCLKTILAKGDRSLIEETRDDLQQIEDKLIFSLSLDNSLSYNSSVIYSLDHVPEIKNFDILSFRSSIGDRPELIEDGLIYQMDDYNGYLCSYLFGIDLDNFPQKLPPQGAYFSVLFFKENQIVDLIKLEESSGLKIFPRYSFKNILTEAAEKFCWENYLRLESLKSEENHFQTIIDQLESQIKNNVSLTSEFLEILTYDYSQFIPFAGKHNDLDKAYDQYLEDNNLKNMTLKEESIAIQPVNYDKNKLDYNMFYMYLSKNPFYDKVIPTTSLEIASTDFSEHIALATFINYSKEVLKYKDKVYVQNSLRENADKFIKKYIEIAKKRTFSFSDFFSLHHKALTDLHYAITSGKRNEAEYAIFREGNTWTLIFEGKAFRGLRPSGFAYIEYMLNQPGKFFTHSELEKIKDGYTIVEQQDPFAGDDAWESIAVGEGLHEIIESDQSIEDLNLEIKWYKHKLDELIEQNGETTEQVKDLKKFLSKKNRSLHSKIKAKKMNLGAKTTTPEETDEGTKIRKKVSISIKRAIKKIAEIADKDGQQWQVRAYLHFKESFPMLDANKIAYQPTDSEIEWHND